jgi:hypothetical protein
MNRSHSSVGPASRPHSLDLWRPRRRHILLAAALGILLHSELRTLNSELRAADDFTPDPSWKRLGKDLWFDQAGNRVVLRARVCQTDAPLEHLLCRKNSKEHESILVTEAPPQMIHAGLLLTGVEPGHPVRFRPKFEPPAGPVIAVEV